MRIQHIKQILLLVMVVFLSTMKGFAQSWNPGHKVGSSTGKQEFGYNQIPDALVEIFPAMLSGSGYTYLWEVSSQPLTGFTAATGTNNQTGYTFSSGLTQTLYIRRKTTFTSNGSSVFSNTIKIRLVSSDWEDINYTRVYEVAVTNITTWQQIDNLPIGSKYQTTQYIDGIGRKLQTVSKGTADKGGGTWGDLVEFQKYELGYGNKEKDYLPYSTTSQPGKYKTSAETEQQQYFSNTYNETNPYSFITYDNSPLELVKNIKQAGTSWNASSGYSLADELNNSADNVQLFDVDYIQGNSPVHKGAYPIKSLFKRMFTDVNGKKVVEFFDKFGRVVLKKVQMDDVPANEYTGWLCTYNVYDDFGLLRFQLQPEAVNYLFLNGWSFAGSNGQAVFNNFCFQYAYDEKGRVNWQKAPGAQPLRTLYDKRDRVVFTQDGNQAAMSTPQWSITLYDALDRPVVAAHYNTSATITTLQSYIDAASAVSSLTIYTNGAAPFTTELSYCPIVSTINNSAYTTILGYSFYDNYAYSGAKTFNTGFTNTDAYNNSDPNVRSITSSKRVLNFPTGSTTRILGTSQFLTTTQYYDENGFSIQSLADNIKSGTDIVTKQYHFDGRLLSTCSDHTVTAAGYTNFKTLTKYQFNQIGKVTSIQKRYGSNAFKTVASYSFDDFGRLKNKTLDPGYASTLGNNYLESLNYSYNLHNQLTGINKDYALKTPGLYNKWEHFFGMYLGYDNRDNVFTSAQLNGKITGVVWSTMGDDVQRKYDFSYDNAGRLSNAVFKEQPHLGDGWSNSQMDFSVSGYGGKITYDLNGNILTMSHKGVTPGSSSPITIDDLRYTYYSYSNQIHSVKDEMTATAHNGKFGDFKDGTNGSGTPDYVYDANGNIVVDLNKNVQNLVGQNGIVYNYLDKPEQIKIQGKGIIKIVYSAGGEKLQRVFIPETSGATATITSYINEFVYQETSTSLTASSTGLFSGNNLALGFIQFEEGRVRVITPYGVDGYDFLGVSGNLTLPNGKMGVYDYFITDYQQNVRMILTEEMRQAGNTATFETDRSAIEESVFGQTGGSNEVSNSRYDTPSGWSNNSTLKTSRLGNLAGINLGPNTLQKVMAGDQVTASVKYYFQTATGGTNTNFSNVILGNLLQIITGGGATGGLVKDNAAAVTSQLGNNTGFINAVQPAGSGGTRPQAFLTILFFDERFNLVPEADGGVYQQQVDASWSSSTSPLVLPGKKAPKNGYFYAFISNRSDQHVYFDDFAVSVVNGNILEENHYYSYGLKITAISSKRITDSYDGLAKNNYQYQGAFNEFDEDISWNDFALRNYDPQIGRFVQQDPYQQFSSPYTGMANDPINTIDPSGGVGIPCPGTSAFSIFMSNAASQVVNIASKISAVGSTGLSLGLIAARSGAYIERGTRASIMINGQVATIQAGLSVSDDSNVNNGYVFLPGDNINEVRKSDGTNVDDWHVTVSDNIISARDKMDDYVKGGKLNNLVISSHGGRGGGAVDWMDRASSLDADIFRIYREHRDWFTKEQQWIVDAIDAFVDLANNVKDGGNLIITGCSAGAFDKGKQLGEELTKITGGRINIYLNRDWSAMRFITRTTGNGKVVSSGYAQINTGNEGLSGRANFRLGWRQFTMDANGSVITKQINSDIKITKSGIGFVKY